MELLIIWTLECVINIIIMSVLREALYRVRSREKFSPEKKHITKRRHETVLLWCKYTFFQDSFIFTMNDDRCQY